MIVSSLVNRTYLIVSSLVNRTYLIVSSFVNRTYLIVSSLVNRTYLIVSSLLMQKRLIQTKVRFNFCYSEPSKVVAAKIFFSSVYVIDATCFDEYLLFHVVTGGHYFWQKFVVTLRFVQPPCCCFLWNKCFERSPYFTYFISTVQC